MKRNKILLILVAILIVAGISIAFAGGNLQALIFKPKTSIDSSKFRNINPISQKNLDAIKKELQKTYCNQKKFKAAFILFYENNNQLTDDALLKINKMKDGFSSAFNIATSGLASMTVLDDLTKIKTKNDFFYEPEIYGNTKIEFDLVAKEFYKNHDDSYDFLLIGTTFGGSGDALLLRVSNNILGIGINENLDISEKYGSSGKQLKGVVNLGDVNYYQFAEDTNPQNLILHEVGHQWCCSVGDNMQGGTNNAKLEIIHEGMHFYRGLESSYERSTPMGAQHWISNGDGTFSVDFSKEYNGAVRKFHPFVLYFMGLLPKEEYSTKFPVYNAGYAKNPGEYYTNYNYDNATFYKTVSVNDIIAVEGERKCK